NFIYLLQVLEHIEYSQISPKNLKTHGLNPQQVLFRYLNLDLYLKGFLLLPMWTNKNMFDFGRYD
ncbi:unnamed protein product, partial [Brassica oleracea var. botrytis]